MRRSTRRSVLKGIAGSGSALALSPGVAGATAEGASETTGRASLRRRCAGESEASLSAAEARFLARQASMRSDLFDGFARRFEDPDLLKKSNFLPSDPVEELAEVVGLAEDDEAPGNHVSVRASDTHLDDWLTGQVGFWADLALVTDDFSPIVGDAIDLVEKLQWFADVARKSSRQQVFNQGLLGCESCSPGGRGQDGDAARRAKSTNETLANRAAKTAEVARSHAEDPSPDRARAVVQRLADEYAAGAETRTIDAWATIDPNHYDVAAAGLGTPEAMQKLGKANAAAIDRIRKVLCFQRRLVTTADQQLVLPSAIETHNETVDHLREETPDLVFDRFTGQSGNLFVVDGSGDGVRTTSVIGFDVGPEGRFTDYSLTPVESDFDVYVKREAASMLGSGKLTDAEVRKLADMDAISIAGNGIVNSVKYGLIDAFVSDILEQIAKKAAESGRVSR